MGHFKYTYDGKWIWDEEESTANGSYTTTFTTGEPIEIKAPNWKTGDKIEINSSINAAPASYGWICPRCGRVNAPWVASCQCMNGKGWEITC